MGKALSAAYEITQDVDGLLLQVNRFPLAQLRFIRSIQLHGQHIRIRETVENLSAIDRPALHGHNM